MGKPKMVVSPIDQEEHVPQCPMVTGAREFKEDCEQFDKHEAEHKAAVAAYKDEWPLYCRECDGWGGESYSEDPSGGVGSLSPGSYVMWDQCSCTDLENCPRCSCRVSRAKREDKWECLTCGWVEQETDGIPVGPEHPEPPGCFCLDLDPSLMDEVTR